MDMVIFLYVVLPFVAIAAGLILLLCCIHLLREYYREIEREEDKGIYRDRDQIEGLDKDLYSSGDISKIYYTYTYTYTIPYT